MSELAKAWTVCKGRKGKQSKGRAKVGRTQESRKISETPTGRFGIWGILLYPSQYQVCPGWEIRSGDIKHRPEVSAQGRNKCVFFFCVPLRIGVTCR